MKPEEFIGKTEADAIALCKEKGLKFRTMRIDNEAFFGTQELNPTRFNFEIENGIIVKVKMY